MLARTTAISLGIPTSALGIVFMAASPNPQSPESMPPLSASAAPTVPTPRPPEVAR